MDPKWVFNRSGLATRYVHLMKVGPGEPLALFGERRTGKTTFIRSDLMPAAAREGFHCIYADLWKVKRDALLSLVASLREAYLDLVASENVVSRRLKTKVSQVGPLKFEVGGERPEPAEPEVRLGYWLDQLHQRSGKPLFLMIDEAQHLAVDANGENIAGALRAALTERREWVKVIFTGSSQGALQMLFARARAPLYEFAAQMRLPRLGRDFVDFIADQHEQAAGASLDREALLVAFEQFDCMPRALMDLVFDMLKDRSTNVGVYLQKHMETRVQRLDYKRIWGQMKPLDQLVLSRVVREAPALSKDALAGYGEVLGMSVSASAAKAAVSRLQDDNLVRYDLRLKKVVMESEAFGQWIAGVT